MMKNKEVATYGRFEKYVMAVVENLSGAFMSEDDAIGPVHLDIETLDATDYFTACAFALCHHFNRLTGNNKQCFEFTQTLTHLVVQHMMQDQETAQ